jgi:hypothetical protein
VAVGDVALDRRCRANGGRRPLDQHGRPRPADSRLPRLRGAVPLPRAEPAALAPLARDLRHLAADPPSSDRLLLRARAGAGHAGGTQPLLGRLARRRAQPAADEEAARAARCGRADPLAGRAARACVSAPFRDVAGRGRARRPTGDPALRRRSGAGVAGHQDGQPPRLRRGGRAPRPRL